jgi:hypothetical protein
MFGISRLTCGRHTVVILPPRPTEVTRPKPKFKFSVNPRETEIYELMMI